MPFTGPNEGRQAIRELYDTYADAANRGDRAQWRSCWAEDTFWQTHYFAQTGREAVCAQFDQLMANVAQTTFFTQIGAIAVEGDNATARVFCQERLVMKTGGSHRLTGQYDDELVREDNDWRFRRRIYTVLIEEFPEQA